MVGHFMGLVGDDHLNDVLSDPLGYLARHWAGLSSSPFFVQVLVSSGKLDPENHFFAGWVVSYAAEYSQSHC